MSLKTRPSTKEEKAARALYSQNPGGKKTCMYSAQGDLVCGLEGRGDKYGDAYYSHREMMMRQQRSVEWADPFNISALMYDGKKLERRDGDEDDDYEERPCCRAKCAKSTGPCQDIYRVHSDPSSLCAKCQLGRCKAQC